MTAVSDRLTGADPRLLLTVEEAARRLNIGRTTMYALVPAGPSSPSPSADCAACHPNAWTTSWPRSGRATSPKPPQRKGGKQMGRNSNGRSSIYEGSDGWWHGRVTVGIKDDGEPDRRHVMAKTKAEVTAKVRKLEKLRDQGRVPKTGQRWRVAAWLTFWLGKHRVPAERLGEHLFRLRGGRARPPHPRNRRALARQARTRARRKALHEDDGQGIIRRGPRTTSTARSGTRSTRPCAAGTSRKIRCCWPRRRGSPRRKPNHTQSRKSGGCSWSPANGATAPAGWWPWR